MNLDIPSDLQPTLETLRSHYQGIVDYANAQLAHAESLLSKPVLSLNPLLATPVATKPVPKKEPVVTEELVTEEPVIEQPTVNSDQPVILDKPKKSPSPRKPTAKSAVKPTAKSAAKTTAKVKPSELLGLTPKYQGKTIMVAIGEALESCKGEIVSTADLVTEIHGSLSSDLFKVAKDRLGKSLSKGKVDGLWYTVPGKIGYYTFLKP